MPRHFHEELEALKQTLLAMGGLVEDQIRRVMRALLERDDAIAQEVIERDRQVNAYDVEVDEQCVSLLALHQPAGRQKVPMPQEVNRRKRYRKRTTFEDALQHRRLPFLIADCGEW